jgi:hypothetical protein
MKFFRSMALGALLALFALMGSVIAQPATISWPDAVGQIAGERFCGASTEVVRRLTVQTEKKLNDGDNRF